MAAKQGEHGISWTDMTWNPVVGCTRVSAGCDNCYAIRQVHRMGHHPNAKVQAANAGLTRDKERGLDWSGEVRCLPERLELPLRLKKPQRIFVNSLSDLFHEQVPDEFIDQVFAVMALCSHNTFQVLTKRPERMYRWIRGERSLDVVLQHWKNHDQGQNTWPLPNVWLGVSVEDQQTANERIPLLLQTPAAVRFLSIEPLLGQIVLAKSDLDGQCDHPCQEYLTEGSYGCTCIAGPWKHNGKAWPAINWVIVGGESGPGARPMHPDWARSIRDQCQASGVPFFFKQWGEWQKTDAVPGGDLGGDVRRGLVELVELNREPDGYFRRGDVLMRRVGKKAAGRLLDGREGSSFVCAPTQQ